MVAFCPWAILHRASLAKTAPAVMFKRAAGSFRVSALVAVRILLEGVQGGLMRVDIFRKQFCELRTGGGDWLKLVGPTSGH